MRLCMALTRTHLRFGLGILLYMFTSHPTQAVTDGIVGVQYREGKPRAREVWARRVGIETVRVWDSASGSVRMSLDRESKYNSKFPVRRKRRSVSHDIAIPISI